MKVDIEKYLGTHNYFDYSSFYDWVAEQNFRMLVEVGVWKGHSIAYLANKLKDKGNHFVLYGVDVFSECKVKELQIEELPYLFEIYNTNLWRAGVRKYITDLRMDSVRASLCFPNEYFDFIFVDADHTYEGNKRDLDAWYPKLRIGGVIAGHDYSNPCGVKQAVDEKFGWTNLFFPDSSNCFCHRRV